MSRHHQTLKHLRQLGLNSGGCGAGLGNGDCGLGNDNGTGEETVPASLDNGVHENSANMQENGHNEGSTPLRESDTEIITAYIFPFPFDSIFQYITKTKDNQIWML